MATELKQKGKRLVKTENMGIDQMRVDVEWKDNNVQAELNL
jgi:hypothetical protein